MYLAQPGSIGPLRLKNRVVMAPMGTNFGTTDGFASDRDTRYYAERAKGGVALVTTEAMVADLPKDNAAPAMPGGGMGGMGGMM